MTCHNDSKKVCIQFKLQNVHFTEVTNGKYLGRNILQKYGEHECNIQRPSNNHFCHLFKTEKTQACLSYLKLEG